VLADAWEHPELRGAFVGLLAVSGQYGTLSHRLEAPVTRGRVLAKTGTTNLSSALSGFAAGRYAFVVVQNGHPISTTWAHKAQDGFATALVRAAD
jgi:D-alanyl-D-alanine carboxypeptidase